MTYVTGAAILTHTGVGTGSAAEQAWAGLCADAIEAAIATIVAGAPDTWTVSASATNELEVAALTDGAALYNSKSAPDGIRSIGPEGDVVRLGSDALRACLPVIRRNHPTANIGIG